MWFLLIYLWLLLFGITGDAGVSALISISVAVISYIYKGFKVIIEKIKERGYQKNLIRELRNRKEDIRELDLEKYKKKVKKLENKLLEEQFPGKILLKDKNNNPVNLCPKCQNYLYPSLYAGGFSLKCVNSECKYSGNMENINKVSL